MTLKVVFSARARRDLLTLAAYITDQSGPKRAKNYVKRIEDYCRGLSNFPERGSLRNHLGRDVRVVGFERRVTIVFHISPTAVTVDRILYAGRTLAPLVNGGA